MLDWVKKEDHSNLILFVHGLKGGVETWRHSPEVSFPDMLGTNPKLSENFDIACFKYFTSFTTTYGVSKSVWGKIFGSFNKIRGNLPIQELGQLLQGEIDVHLSGYKGIYIIAHSMGGLVAKACILKQIEELDHSLVKCFISLAVPHGGAKAANLASLISSNVQVGDLGVMSSAVDKLGRDWLELHNPPYTKYIYASHDPVVDKKSALPFGSKTKDCLAVDEDHTSICKPANADQTVYKAVVRYIVECESQCKPPLQVKKFVDEKQYDDHYFFLKMILADVHQVIAGHAKGYFFNAEAARKIFTSEYDQERLSELYETIRSIYQQEYQYHVAHGTSSNVFIEAVHRRIYEERDGYLKTVLAGLTDGHKKGMLHQLADALDLSVVWSEDTSIEAIEKLRGNC